MLSGLLTVLAVWIVYRLILSSEKGICKPANLQVWLVWLQNRNSKDFYFWFSNKFLEKSAVTISSDDESFLYEKPIANVPPRTPKVLIQQNLKEMIARNTPVKQQVHQNPSSQGLKHCTKKEYEVQQQKVEMLRKKIFETEVR